MAEQSVADRASEFVEESQGGEFEQDSFVESSESGENDQAGAAGTGFGQSKSSRRRRRKRKKQASGGVVAEVAGAGGEEPAGESGFGAAPVPIVMEGERLALAASAAPAPTSRRTFFAQGASQGAQNGGFGQGQPQGQGQNQGQGPGKRWKKKFRDRDRDRRVGVPGGEARPEGGFSNSGGDRPYGSGERSFGGGDRNFSGGDRGFDRPHRREGGGRPDNFGNLISHQQRKAKVSGGGRERGFVGPMDHSYREVSPEFAEAPPSTIQVRGRRGHRPQGDGQPIDMSAPRPVPMPEDAQTHIYLFVEELFLTAKVQETARKLGVKVAFVKNDKEVIADLTSGEDTNRPALIVFDLNNGNAKPLTLIPKLKAKLKRSVSIVGYLSTIQGDLKAKAMEAGCDTVMPKAAFSQSLPNLLRRYGVEEAEEVNYNY